jgi:aspartyl-tRNA(Asn)/glutamyl-tRNA(Gln) amidotransferase subunit B
MSRTTPSAETLAPDVLARYEPVIGLEMHVQLKTATKIFCACSTRFGDAPNSNTCPVCLGLPGALPVFNRRALELAVRAALALHCTVHERSRFARKNYFYPDLPKGYQISMYEMPLATGGWLEIEHEGARKRVGITRLHLEDDAAKGMHEGFPDSGEKTYIDYNRGGVPLIEIVSEPDLRSPEEAHAYLTALRQVLVYTGVSDCNMEEGSLRCDANVSVRRRGAEKFGTKAEVKNLNSFRYLQRALEHEIERQVSLLESGGQVTQETRLYHVVSGRTEAMRSKEFAHDYRYFPEPDLLPVRVSEAMKTQIAAEMPELPDARRQRYSRDFGITAYDAGVLTDTRELGDYFEEVVKAGAHPKAAANWIQTELLRLLNDAGKGISESPVTPGTLAKVILLAENQQTTVSGAKATLAMTFKTGEAPEKIVAREGFQRSVTPRRSSGPAAK